MAKYQVFDGGKPADCHHHKVNESWNKSTFDTFEEAFEYCFQWLGEYSGAAPEVTNYPVDYSGYGDFIEIKVIEV